jgi:hypothetical protein
MAIAAFGMVGMWEKFLFISLKPLQESWQWSVGLIAAGFFCWAVAGALLRRK